MSKYNLSPRRLIALQWDGIHEAWQAWRGIGSPREMTLTLSISAQIRELRPCRSGASCAREVGKTPCGRDYAVRGCASTASIKRRIHMDVFETHDLIRVTDFGARPGVLFPHVVPRPLRCGVCVDAFEQAPREDNHAFFHPPPECIPHSGGLVIRRPVTTHGLNDPARVLLNVSTQTGFGACNHHALDFAGAFIDLGDLGITEVALQRHFLGVAHAAVDLYGLMCNPHRRFGSHQLGY